MAITKTGEALLKGRASTSIIKEATGFYPTPPNMEPKHGIARALSYVSDRVIKPDISLPAPEGSEKKVNLMGNIFTDIRKQLRNKAERKSEQTPMPLSKDASDNSFNGSSDNSFMAASGSSFTAARYAGINPANLEKVGFLAGIKNFAKNTLTYGGSGLALGLGLANAPSSVNPQNAPQPEQTAFTGNAGMPKTQNSGLLPQQPGMATQPVQHVTMGA